MMHGMFVFVVSPPKSKTADSEVLDSLIHTVKTVNNTWKSATDSRHCL